MKSSGEVRLRKPSKKLTDIVRDMDSFPKMPADYKHHSGIGGLVTIFMYLCLIALILSEIVYYRTSYIYNKFVPDTDFDDKLKITVDMTVAMRCHDIGADIVDVTNQESKKFGKFTLEDVWFKLDPNQQEVFDNVRRQNSYLRERYHSLRDILWLAGYYSSYFTELPPRTTHETTPTDACRISGELELNKVAGNFHITLGKSLSIPGGHIHLQQLFPVYYANFSHRIDKFYFGDPGPAILHPLDSSFKTAVNNTQAFKYYIEVIATDVDTSKASIKTYQYSVKELTRFTDSRSDSHEMAGIFFKYDINPLKIIIREEEYTLLQFILRIFGCAGGLYIVSGLFTNLCHAYVCYKYGDGIYLEAKLSSKDESQKSSSSNG